VIQGRLVQMVRRVLTALRVIQAPPALTGHRVLMVTPVHQVLMGCLRMRLRSMPGLLGAM
jgi:hypothetical protein